MIILNRLHDTLLNLVVSRIPWTIEIDTSNLQETKHIEQLVGKNKDDWEYALEKLVNVMSSNNYSHQDNIDIEKDNVTLKKGNISVNLYFSVGGFQVDIYIDNLLVVNQYPLELAAGYLEKLKSDYFVRHLEGITRTFLSQDCIVEGKYTLGKEKYGIVETLEWTYTTPESFHDYPLNYLKLSPNLKFRLVRTDLHSETYLLHSEDKDKIFKNPIPITFSGINSHKAMVDVMNHLSFDLLRLHKKLTEAGLDCRVTAPDKIIRLRLKYEYQLSGPLFYIYINDSSNGENAVMSSSILNSDDKTLARILRALCP